MHSFRARHFHFIVGPGLSLLLSCASAPGIDPEPVEAIVVTSPSPSPTLVPVVRQSRYTLIELRPDAAQQDLQRQVIDLRIPATPDTTVGDALRYVLLRSGYRLCENDSAPVQLFALPLPAAHLQLGPLPLSEALQLLAGKAWRLSIDERSRQVCFIANEDIQP